MPLIRHKFVIVILTIIYPLFGSINAQVQDSREANFLKGLALYNMGRLHDAVAALQKAHEKNPEDLGVLQFLGRIEVERENWSNARDWLLKAVKIGPEEPMVNYYLGICYRETGKFKAFVLRRRDWSRSERYFNAVLSVDQTYRDILFQFATLRKYQDRYFEAADLAQQQLSVRKEPLEAVVGSHQYFDVLLANEGFEEVRSWLSQREGSLVLYYLGDLYRRHERFASADSLFDLLLVHPDTTLSMVPVRLSYALSLFQQERQSEVETVFNTAIDSIKTAIDAALFFDFVKFILSDEEYAEYTNCPTVDCRRDFFKRMWAKRDPMPASTSNIRILNHLSRYIYAEKYFRYDGFRLWANNPDKLAYLSFPRVFSLNHKYNDKGLVYLRHGEPDDKAFTVAPGLPDNESWIYRRSGPIDKKLIYHFFIDENASGNNWRLVAVFPDDDPDLLNKLIESRMELDPIFSRMYNQDERERQMQWQRFRFEMSEQSKESALVGLNTDRHRWEEEIIPVYMPFYVSTFRGRGQDTRYEIYYGLRRQDLHDEDGSFDYDVNLGFAVFDSRWSQVDRTNLSVAAREIVACSDSIGIWPGQFVFEAPPDRYNFSLFVRVPERKILGGYKFKYGPVSYSRDDVDMSSVELAMAVSPETQEGPFSKNGLEILPVPDRSFRREKPIYVYFEIYNLPIRGKRRVDYTIEYKVKLLERYRSNVFTKLWGLVSDKKPETSNTIERFATQEQSIEYLALDMSRYPRGKYDLEISLILPELENLSRKREFELR